MCKACCRLPGPLRHYGGVEVALPPCLPQSSVSRRRDLSSAPIGALSFLTTNILKLVFSSEQEQKSLEFFIWDLFSSVSADLQPGVSELVYYWVFFFSLCYQRAIF